jgi:protein-disulfide isomerase
MAIESQLYFVSPNTMPIVGNPYQPLPAVNGFYHDGTCPGVKRIFDKLLDDGSGTFNHFPSGYLAGDFIR